MLYWVPLQKTSLEGALWFGNYCSTPSQSILLRLLRGLKDVLLGNVRAHVIRPRFLISISLLMILTHACLSCCNSHSRQFYLGKLLQLEIFAWIAAAALKERGGWSVCHFGVGQKKRNQSCSLIRFFLVFGWGESHIIQLANVSIELPSIRLKDISGSPLFMATDHIWDVQNNKINF